MENMLTSGNSAKLEADVRTFDAVPTGPIGGRTRARRTRKPTASLPSAKQYHEEGPADDAREGLSNAVVAAGFPVGRRALLPLATNTASPTRPKRQSLSPVVLASAAAVFLSGGWTLGARHQVSLMTDVQEEVLRSYEAVNGKEAQFIGREVSLQQGQTAAAAREASALNAVIQKQNEVDARIASFEGTRLRIEEELRQRGAGLDERVAALASRETALALQGEELMLNRKSIAAETARLHDSQLLQRKEREDFDSQRYTLAADRQTFAQERATSERLRQTAERMATDAAAERQRLTEGKRALDEQWRKLAEERSSLESQQRLLIAEQQKGKQQAVEQMAELIRKEAEVKHLRNMLVSEWNTIVDGAHPNTFAAIAADRSGAAWQAYNYNSARTARQAVMQPCELQTRTGGCKVVHTMRGCVAMARGANGGWSIDVGRSRNDAGATAVKSCGAVDTGCKVKPADVVCSGL